MVIAARCVRAVELLSDTFFNRVSYRPAPSYLWPWLYDVHHIAGGDGCPRGLWRSMTNRSPTGWSIIWSWITNRAAHQSVIPATWTTGTPRAPPSLPRGKSKRTHRTHVIECKTFNYYYYYHKRILGLWWQGLSTNPRVNTADTHPGLTLWKAFAGHSGIRFE